MPRLMLLLAAATLVLAVPALAQDRKVEVQWLGQSCFKITTPGGKVIVTDPFILNNPKTPPELKNFDALGKVDLILVSHAHDDHFIDAPALSKKNNAPILTAGGLGSLIVALDMVPQELAPRFNKGGTVQPFGAGGIRITATHAEHSGEYRRKNPETGKNEVHFGGEPVGYVIEMENGFKVYFMGDTGIFGDLKLIGELYKPDLVLIPIGGHFTMDPKDAALATRDMIKPRFAIPMHYATLPIMKGTPEEYIKALGNAPVKVFPLKPGEKATF